MTREGAVAGGPGVEIETYADGYGPVSPRPLGRLDYAEARSGAPANAELSIDLDPQLRRSQLVIAHAPLSGYQSSGSPEPSTIMASSSSPMEGSPGPENAALRTVFLTIRQDTCSNLWASIFSQPLEALRRKLRVYVMM